MKLVFISIEFTAGTFSGNGVYAASQVPPQVLCAGATHKCTSKRTRSPRARV